MRLKFGPQYINKSSMWPADENSWLLLSITRISGKSLYVKKLTTRTHGLGRGFESKNYIESEPLNV